MTGFWIFMLVTSLIIPFTMIGFGKLFTVKAPADINDLFGYRTAMSMKNRDTWEFAHKYCGKLWFRFGAVMLPFSVFPFLCVFGKDIDITGYVGGAVMGVQLVCLILPVFFTEAALKKSFDRNGRRRMICEENEKY